MTFADGVGKSRATPSIREVNIRLLLDQQLDDAHVAHGCGQMEARPTVVVGRIDIATGVQQVGDALDTPATRKVAQVPRGLVIPVAKLGPCSNEYFGNVPVALSHGIGQRCASPSVPEHQIRLEGEQHFDDQEIASRGGEMQTRATVVVRRVNRAACQQQRFDAFEVATFGHLAQLARCLALVKQQLPAGLADHVCTLAMTFADGVGEGRAAPPIREVDVYLLVDQQVDDVHVAHRCGQMEACPEIVVGRIDRCSSVQEQVDALVVT